MNRNKYKVLVLSNLKGNAKETIQYAIEISKEINAALELFCVKKPKEVVTTENPLSAMRDVSKCFIKTEEKARELITEINKNNFFAVKRTIEFGNVKNEIEKHIKHTKPDIIILGSKQKKFFKLESDNITTFIENKYQNKVFIANKNNTSDVFIYLNQKQNSVKSA